MATHFGPLATAFHARTSYGVLACNVVPRIRAPIGPGELGLMLASLNFSITDQRGGRCPMCTDGGPCFLCSDELKWKEYTDIQARRKMAICPVLSLDAQHTCSIPGPVPLNSQPTHTATWHKIGGEICGFCNAPAAVATEPFDTSDVDELVAYYDEDHKAEPHTEKGLPNEDEEGTAADAYPGLEAPGPNRDDDPYD